MKLSKIARKVLGEWYLFIMSPFSHSLTVVLMIAILFIVLLSGCSTTPLKEEVSVVEVPATYGIQILPAIKYRITFLTSCKTLLLNSTLSTKVKLALVEEYQQELATFADKYAEAIVFFTGRSHGYLVGMVDGRGITGEASERLALVADELLIQYCMGSM